MGDDDQIECGSLKSVKELAVEGQKRLEDTVNTTFQIPFVMDDELCNPTLWSPIPPIIPGNGTVSAILANSQREGINGDVTFDTPQGIGGSALDEDRLRYKSSVTSLRDILSEIPDSQMVANDNSPSQTDEDETMKLQDQTTEMRMELAEKNRHLKHLIDQLRDLMTDVTTWPSPHSVVT